MLKFLQQFFYWIKRECWVAQPTGIWIGPGSKLFIPRILHRWPWRTFYRCDDVMIFWTKSDHRVCFFERLPFWNAYITRTVGLCPCKRITFFQNSGTLREVYILILVQIDLALGAYKKSNDTGADLRLGGCSITPGCCEEGSRLIILLRFVTKWIEINHSFNFY